jgi:hypothetical protein
LLVGGYGGYKEIQWIIKDAYPKQRLVCPPESDLVVVKGAVIFGHIPDVISSRISKMWYGIQIPPDVNPMNCMCEGDFYPVIRKGQPMKIGEKLEHKFYIVDSFKGDFIILKQVNSSEDDLPVYVENVRCLESENSLRVPIPMYQRNMRRILRISVKFKGTEIEYSSFVIVQFSATKNTVQVT